MRHSTKWIAFLAALCTGAGVFLLIRAQTVAFFNPAGIWGIERQYFFAILFAMLGAIFFVITFLRFIRSRTLLGGIITSAVITSGLFFVSMKLLNAVPYTGGAAGVGGAAGAANGQVGAYAARYSFNLGANFTINLAHIGLFAIFLLLLAVLIYFQTRPVARIQKALENIVDGRSCQTFKIGKSKQFKKIEQELAIISATICQHQIMQAKQTENRDIKKEKPKPKNGKKAKKKQI